MFFRLLLLFVVVPILELFILAWLGDTVGWLETFALVLLTGVAGAALAKRQGLAAWMQIHNALAAGRVPATELLDGVMILAAGLLLLTPGIITDAFGFALLIPLLRAPLRSMLIAYVKPRVTVTASPGGTWQGRGSEQPDDDPDVIDVEAKHIPTLGNTDPE